MSLLDRARASGRCPPSLLKDEGTDDASAFEAAVTRVLDATGMCDVRLDMFCVLVLELELCI
jgi:hypothetical protein